MPALFIFFLSETLLSDILYVIETDYMNSLETGKDCNYFSLLQTIRNANLKLKTIELDHR